MGSHGRYGKYGETKRFARLRKAGTRPTSIFREDEAYGRHEQRRNKPVSKNQIKLRSAGVTDADFIHGLSKRVFNRYGNYEDTLTRWFLSGVTITVLATIRNRPVGFAMLGRSAGNEPFSRVYELLAIAVEPEMQKLGIGNFLMKAVVGKTEELLAEKLVLHTAVDNIPGRKLFKKHGFISSHKKNHFYPEGQDAMMMYREFG